MPWWAFIPSLISYTGLIHFISISLNAPQRSTSVAKTLPLEFVGSKDCAQCHSDEWRYWRDSHHALSMAELNHNSVLADFAQPLPKALGLKLSKSGSKHYVSDGKNTYPITHTFGTFPLQQYLVHMPDGRLQASKFAWDCKIGKWYLLGEGRNPLEWKSPSYNWNHMCADCHSTNVRKQFHFETSQYRTSYSEISVSCEACHGPGSQHSESAKINHASVTPMPVSRPGITQCAKCHSHRRRISENDPLDQHFLDSFDPTLLESPFYHASGAINDEVYEYGSFLQSPMYLAGVRCTDCHDPHTASLRETGNALCLNCHQSRKYAHETHHRHPHIAEATKCINCHMPKKTYMGVDDRRDHSFSIPDPLLALELGEPGACLACHQERDQQWFKRKLKQWHWNPNPFQRSYARAIWASQTRSLGAENRIQAVLNKGVPSAIKRATLVSQLSKVSSAQFDRVVYPYLFDSDPLVRLAAVRRWRYFPSRIPRDFARLIFDPIRAVRVAAASILVRVSPEAQSTLAFGEYVESLKMDFDQPEALANFAVLMQGLQSWEVAEAAYHRALVLRPDFIEAKINLAQLYQTRGGWEQALAQLNEVLILDQTNIQAHYLLGKLFLSQSDTVSNAREHIRKAINLKPKHPMVWYQLGNLSERLNETSWAEQCYLKALNLEPRNIQYVSTLSRLLVRSGAVHQARRYLKRWLELAPNDPQAMELNQLSRLKG